MKRLFSNHMGVSKILKNALFGVLFAISIGVAFLPASVGAQGLADPSQISGAQIADVPGEAGLALPATDIRIIVARIIRVALSFLGIAAVALIVYGGFLWMTSAGNEEQLERAKKTLTNAVVGLVIILSALGIVQFLIGSFTRDAAAPPLPPPRGAPARVGGGALGSGIIESHFPMRGARNIPRNTRVIVTFKEPIDPSSIAGAPAVPPAPPPGDAPAEISPYFYAYDDDGDGNIDRRVAVSGLALRTDAVQILHTADIQGSVRESGADRYLGADGSGAHILVSFTEDLRTFVFTPVEPENHAGRVLFGSVAEDVAYTVYICGTASSRGNCAQGGVRLLSGQSAFQGIFSDYQWSFETGTFIDATPPQIRNVVPRPDKEQDVPGAARDRKDQPRNVILQINFSEAVLPTSASGRTLVSGGSGPARGPDIVPGSYGVMRVGADAEWVAGEWRIANQYRTAEFTTAALCGRNSCGSDVFCLPGPAAIGARIRAATLLAPGSPESAGLFDGIEDVAGNSLDGNRDGTAQGHGDYSPGTFFNLNRPEERGVGDNAMFSFWTNDTILLGSPLIERTFPPTTRGILTPGAPLSAPVEQVFDRFMASSTLNSRNIALEGSDEITGARWDGWWTVESENLPDDGGHPFGSTKGRILHGGLWEEARYFSAASSEVKDLYQNCFSPSGGQGIEGGGAAGGACSATAARPFCCNGIACSAGDVNCQVCGF